MSSSISARRGFTAALTVLAAAVLSILVLTPAPAGAAETVGSATITITSGKAGRVAPVSPAVIAKRIGKKGAKVKGSLAGGSFATGNVTGLRFKGGLKLKNGKRSVKIGGLKLALDKKIAVVRGNTLGKKNVVIFVATGKGSLGSDPASAKFSGGQLKFGKNLAKKIQKRLKLRTAPTGKIGKLFVFAKQESSTPVDPCAANPDAEGCPIVDPYLAQCDVAATSKVTGSLAPAAALPVLSDPVSVTGPNAINWGFKSSFRNYLVSPGANGSVHAIDGATATGPAPAFTGVDFPIVGGQYADNGTADLSDDQAIVNTSGTLVLCATGHNFRVTISDPTFVVDGFDSRVIADVDTNLSGVWTPAQRVDLAQLNQVVGEVVQEPAESGSSISATIAGTLTETGADAICGTGEQAACNYTDVTPVDDLNLKVEVASDMPASDTYSSECGVPVAKVASGLWSSTHNEPLPPLRDPVATTAPTSIDWGFKDSFRQYVQYSPPAGSFQGLDGATATGGPSPVPINGFSFPVSDGLYEINDPENVSDDQAIINGTGTGLICKAGHGFWVSITDPTIVIDGSDSRIEATISQNTYGPDGSGPWETPERIDLARLDLDEVDPVYSGSQVTWSDIPVILLQEFATYAPGEQLDPITVSLDTE